MGSRGKTATVGYWYKLLLHFGICRARIDALLEMRVGDRTAWAGLQTASGTIAIDKPDLFGGEGAEGGVVGSLDVMMGEAGQAPNAYLVSQLGAGQSAYRGKVTAVWKGGRWGAMNPYPKAASFKVRRSSYEWHSGTAEIIVGPGAEVPTSFVESFSSAAPYSGDLALFTFGSSPWGGSVYLGAQTTIKSIVRSLPALPGTVTIVAVRFQLTIGGQADDAVIVRVLRDSDSAELFVFTPRREDYYDASRRPFLKVGAGGSWQAMPGPLPGGKWLRLTVEWTPDTGAWVAKVLDDATVISTLSGTHATFLAGASGGTLRINSDASAGKSSVPVAYADFRLLGNWPQGTVAMNPAHILYDSIASPDMLGEPGGAIDDASFGAAADVLYAEGFGLCTTYDATAESIDDFQKRICAVIGATCTRDRRSGKWMLDLQRGGGDAELLPVLTDDDILDYSSEPGTLDDAVNQVVVEWLDPMAKEERSTAPVQALGLIQSLGGVVSETVQYPEIPAEGLALRVAARDLRNRATPLRRFELKTNRVPFGWRAGTYFRLQAPKRGIADMVCLIGEIDIGTLRQGAISITAVQDVFSMPAAVYVTPQPAPEQPSGPPAAAEHQRAIEAPYTELARALSVDELAALAADACYVAVMAGQAARAWNYELLTAAGGEDLQSRGSADWTPTCATTAQADYLDGTIAIADALGMDGLTPPVAAAWDDEIVRVDAIDLMAGTITVGRGCADTVPAVHAAGSRLYLFGARAGADGREYAEGETVSAKVLSRGSGGLLDAEDTPALTRVMAGRAARPYPPAGLTINGEAYPAAVTGAVIVSWAHRDRVQQADALLDAAAASVGPEPGTTYNVRLHDDETSELVTQALHVAGASATIVVPAGLVARLEVEAERAGLASWQRQVRRFINADGLVLVEDGSDYFVTEAGELLGRESERIDLGALAHHATIALGGTFSASDAFAVTVGLDAGSGTTNYFYAEAGAAGLTTLAQFAAVLAGEIGEALAGRAYAQAEGAVVHLYSAAAIASVSVYAAWLEGGIGVSTAQAPLPAAAGTPALYYIDLWQRISDVSYTLSPTNSPAYETLGPAFKPLRVGGTTYAARKAIRALPAAVGETVRSAGVYWSVSTKSTYYRYALEGGGSRLWGAIEGDSVLAGFGLDAGPATLAGMSRQAVAIECPAEYALLEDYDPFGGAMNYGNHPSGYVPRMFQLAPGTVAQPGGAKQLDMVTLRFPAGGAPAAGQKIVVTLDGTPYTYTCSGSEAGAEDIAVGLAALIEPGGDFTVDWYDGYSAIEIERTVSNTAFTCSAWAGYGATASVAVVS